MVDETEEIRREMVQIIGNRVASGDPVTERKRLEAEYGQVWNTLELTADFEVKSFFAPFVYVIRKSDGAEGTLLFQHMPRFYFAFEEVKK